MLRSYFSFLLVTLQSVVLDLHQDEPEPEYVPYEPCMTSAGARAAGLLIWLAVLYHCCSHFRSISTTHCRNEDMELKHVRVSYLEKVNQL